MAQMKVTTIFKYRISPFRPVIRRGNQITASSGLSITPTSHRQVLHIKASREYTHYQSSKLI